MARDVDNPVLQALRTRRVTRSMREQPIDPELVQLVARSAQWAPNAGNRRLQTTLVVEDPADVRLLKSVAPGMVPSPQAVIALCLDSSRARQFGLASNYRGLYIDIGTAAATILITAHSVGLGACPVTSFSRAAASRLLHLPEHVSPEMLICLGYPAPRQPATMPSLAGPAPE